MDAPAGAAEMNERGTVKGLIPWLRRVIAGNLPVDADVARLRQELERANARADQAERDLERACEAAWRAGDEAGYEAGYHHRDDA